MQYSHKIVLRYSNGKDYTLKLDSDTSPLEISDLTLLVWVHKAVFLWYHTPAREVLRCDRFGITGTRLRKRHKVRNPYSKTKMQKRVEFFKHTIPKMAEEAYARHKEEQPNYSFWLGENTP